MPKTFVISTERLIARQRAFQEANKSSIGEFEFFFGVDRSKLDGNERVAKWIDLDSTDWTLSSIATSITHLELWELVSQGPDCAVILEDDARLVKSFAASLSDILTSLDKDWDIVLLGHNFDAFTYFQLLPSAFGIAKLSLDQSALISNFGLITELEVSPKLFRLNAAWGVSGYLISPKGARQLLARIPRLQSDLVSPPGVGWQLYAKSIDGLMNMHYSQLESYLCLPPITFVKNDYDSSSQDSKL